MQTAGKKMKTLGSLRKSKGWRSVLALNPQGRSGSRSGFTLIEILLVVAILLVAAAMSVPLISSASSTKAMAAADQLLADLEYAKSLAISQGRVHAVVFDKTTESYQIQDSTGTVVAHPVNPGPYVVSYPGSHLSGVDLFDAVFEATSTVKFDSLGSPYDGSGNPLSSSGVVTLKAGGLTTTVTITPVTGYTSIN